MSGIGSVGGTEMPRSSSSTRRMADPEPDEHATEPRSSLAAADRRPGSRRGSPGRRSSARCRAPAARSRDAPASMPEPSQVQVSSSAVETCSDHRRERSTDWPRHRPSQRRCVRMAARRDRSRAAGPGDGADAEARAPRAAPMTTTTPMPTSGRDQRERCTSLLMAVRRDRERLAGSQARRLRRLASRMTETTTQPKNPDRLELEQLTALQPGLARLMPEIGARFWKAFYAAQAEQLAARRTGSSARCASSSVSAR